MPKSSIERAVAALLASTTAACIFDGGGEGASADLPQDCVDVQVGEPGAFDGDYTLYYQGRADMPWTARCVDLNATPREYLTLSITGPEHNYSSHTPTPAIVNQSTVVTYYQRVRIDPRSLVVDTSDDAFARTIGWVVSEGSAEVESMPFGAAMSCDDVPSASANIDLGGTPFVLAEEFCIGGDGASGGWQLSADRRSVDLYGGGGCGWTSVTRGDQTCAVPPHTAGPTGGGGQFLELAYRR